MGTNNSCLVCHGTRSERREDANDPKESITNLWHSLKAFGYIHCIGFCANCSERRPSSDSGNYTASEYQKAFDKLHNAFESLPAFIFDAIPNSDTIQCPACALLYALRQFPLLVNANNNCLESNKSTPCYIEPIPVTRDAEGNVQEWGSIQIKHIESLAKYSSNFDFPRGNHPGIPMDHLLHARVMLEHGHAIAEFFDELRDNVLGGPFLERLAEKDKKQQVYLNSLMSGNPKEEDNEYPAPPGSLGFWHNKDLMPALEALRFTNCISERQLIDFPNGFWYHHFRKITCEEFGRKIEPLFSLGKDISEMNPRIIPYVRDTEGEYYYIDPWYIISLYDAITLHTGLDYLAKTFDGDYEDVYSRHFTLIKKEAIDGLIYLPHGRDILLNVSSDKINLEKRELIILDIDEFFKYIIERSGMPKENVPGSIIARYEKKTLKKTDATLLFDPFFYEVDFMEKGKGNAIEKIGKTNSNADKAQCIDRNEDKPCNGDPNHGNVGSLEPTSDSPEKRFDPNVMITRPDIISLLKVDGHTWNWLAPTLDSMDIKPCFIPKHRQNPNAYWRTEIKKAMAGKRETD